MLSTLTLGMVGIRLWTHKAYAVSNYLDAMDYLNIDYYKAT